MTHGYEFFKMGFIERLRMKGIFYGVHTFKLKSSEQGKTILMHNEDFSGIAIGFADLPPDVIAEGYHQMNMALKSRVETKN